MAKSSNPQKTAAKASPQPAAKSSANVKEGSKTPAKKGSAQKSK